MTTTGFIGAGNMAYALAKAMNEKVVCYDIVQERLDLFKKEFDAEIAENNKEVVEKADVTFLAVKPQHMAEVVKEFKDTNKLIISIAAGITISFLEENLPNARIVRVMPNTPCMVQEMAAGYSFGSKTTEDDKKTVNALLNKAGLAIEVKEELIDTVIGVSGSGPAFMARFFEAIIEAGVKEGLTEEESKKLTLQTAIGTAKMLKEMTPEELVNMVSSPGGTTIAGREILEKSNYKEIIQKTISRTIERSKELQKLK